MSSRKNPAKLRLNPKERLGLLTDLSTMLTAGIPIIEAVRALETDTKGHLNSALRHIRASLNNGQPLSHALATMPHAFDAVTVNLVRAAEAGGTLETTLRDIVIATKKEMTFSEQLRNTMVYPVFVMVIFLGIVTLMLTFVIPRVADVFSKLNVEMPWITKVMITSSNYFMENWLILTVGFVALIALASVVLSRNKRWLVRMVLSLPFLRKLGTNIDFSRFTRSFGLLLKSGVPIVEALELSEKVVQKKSVIEVIGHMKSNLRSGRPLGSGLRQEKNVVPLIMSRSIETAETSGTLEDTMEGLNDYFDQQVSERLRVLSSLVEPVLLILVGGLVGFLMLSIIAPIYNMISQISPQG